jgi:hypothetical protein
MNLTEAAVAPCRVMLKYPYSDYFLDVLACIFFLRDLLQFECPNKYIMNTLTSYFPFTLVLMHDLG